MKILTTNLPSGGYGYKFPTVNVQPMTFLEITRYMENVPSKDQTLERYMFDIETVVNDDKNILDCLLIDLDFLIFYKKLITVSEDNITYTTVITCPDCKKSFNQKISVSDVKFKQIDPAIMEGALITLNGHKYEAKIPTVREFVSVFSNYLRYRKIKDLDMIKTIALISASDFSTIGAQAENDVLNATHNDITMLLGLKDLYYNGIIDPVTAYCPNCNGNDGNRGAILINTESIAFDFFRDLPTNSPIDESKIYFKQAAQSR